MELWIRSQDKMLLSKAVDIRIVIEQEGASIIDDTTTYILGTYKTEERALEVLDEIQQILCPKKLKATIGKNVEFILGTVYVYEIPKE